MLTIDLESWGLDSYKWCFGSAVNVVLSKDYGFTILHQF